MQSGKELSEADQNKLQQEILQSNEAQVKAQMEAAGLDGMSVDQIKNMSQADQEKLTQKALDKQMSDINSRLSGSGMTMEEMMAMAESGMSEEEMSERFMEKASQNTVLGALTKEERKAISNMDEKQIERYLSEPSRKKRIDAWIAKNPDKVDKRSGRELDAENAKNERIGKAIERHSNATETYGKLLKTTQTEVNKIAKTADAEIAKIRAKYDPQFEKLRKESWACYEELLSPKDVPAPGVCEAKWAQRSDLELKYKTEAFGIQRAATVKILEKQKALVSAAVEADAAAVDLYKASDGKVGSGGGNAWMAASGYINAAKGALNLPDEKN
ncbi:MAG: hypothetical protein LBQ52_03870 [Helicobacteraceae bacterium]|nr:hypothetical protein [Helicobacteraceae bacterium]